MTATPATLRPLDRAAFALGTALVTWSRHNAQRNAARIASRRLPSGHEARELHELRRAAALGRTQIEASRDLGINQLLS